MWINPHSKNITKVLEMLLKHLLRKRAMVCSIKINFYIKLFFRKISWFYDFIEFDDATAVDKVLNIKQHIVNGSTWLVNKAVPKYLNNPAQLIHIRHLNFIIVGNMLHKTMESSTISCMFLVLLAMVVVDVPVVQLVIEEGKSDMI
jgi:hypothetical protein